jgi:BirA family transcriptional regulator, biotin operon repressor / biotin---[acetyl-CoA-carboxylase] ligase
LISLDFHIQTFETLVSTQDEMRSKLEHGEAIHGLVIRALEQTAGRGQRARDWQSSKGGSYQTIAVEMANHKSYSAILVAIGIARVFREQAIQASIKWPNDIYMENKKLAGILCEYTRGHLLIGVGVNVHNDIPEYATRLQGLEVEAVNNLVLDGVKQGLELLQSKPDLPNLFKLYDFLEGKSLSIKASNGIKEGIARGIDQNGCLRLEQEQVLITICSGRIQTIHL